MYVPWLSSTITMKASAVTRIHERIEETNATIVGIFRGRVIIEHNGKQEITILTKVLANAPYTQHKKSPAQISVPLPSMVKIRYASLTTCRFSPKMEGSELIGYELQPGNEREWFYDAGLNDGDVAVAVNGADLTDDSKMSELMQKIAVYVSQRLVYRSALIEVPVMLN